MDPVSLVVTALAAGAAIGLKDTASAAVTDAYENLKVLVKRCGFLAHCTVNTVASSTQIYLFDICGSSHG